MAQDHKSFERLSDILEHIEEDQISQAIASIRERRAGKSGAGIQPLAGMLEQLEQHELMWLEMVLCVRVQQTGRDEAWRRFAEPSHREFVPLYR